MSATSPWTWRGCWPRPATNCCPPRSRPTSTRASRPTRPSRSTSSAAAARPRPSSRRSSCEELDHSPTIEVIVNPEDIDYDEGSDVAAPRLQAAPTGRHILRAVRDPRPQRPPAQAVPALLRVPHRDPRRGRQSRRTAHRAHRTRRHRQRPRHRQVHRLGAAVRSTAPSATCRTTCRAAVRRAGRASSPTRPAGCSTQRRST